MRIITGIAKGRKIKVPEGNNTRPTLDRVKESIFNIVNNRIPDSFILDLFAGSGNLGLECISRGSKSCIFCEKNKTAFSYLKENVINLGFNSNCELYNHDAFFVLKKCAQRNLKFDIIFLDPPYGRNLIIESLKNIDCYNLLDTNGIIITEYDENDIIPDKIGHFTKYRTEKYGRVRISFWNKEEINE
ncbi:16S rRNA (guanine(966)-N(2))-methyltransferase RsmD [Caloramator quimbayensis]|uniref:16S rRNA (Guanine(966)-N(2))-methyltransferase RsmD n=1 Tax=Caloramator quimbayensis TaxID=1147123 RepID=A0A1T4XSH1_9CLOT|nr:16S rRNA (guanine(966)-N(2))-methyltransferase RsmD [Caloramator quimbayensis]SKA92313.1 16S rRNA (guanine(966)-N(2))-methyltransferase RsmD [Caloramator quimbayensis]